MEPLGKLARRSSVRLSVKTPKRQHILYIVLTIFNFLKRVFYVSNDFTRPFKHHKSKFTGKNVPLKF